MLARRFVPAALGMLLAACAGVSTPMTPAASTRVSGTGELTVFAAASLTQAFTELGGQFEATHPGTRVSFSFGGSNQLAQQLGQGAPADVFASANTRQMEAAVASGRVLSETVRVFAHNRLVVVTPLDNPANLGQLQDLARPGVRLVLAAPEVPAGQYALDFIERAAQDPALGPEYAAGVRANIVSYEENVRAVLSKVALGEADAGIVYTSDAVGAGTDQVRQMNIPDALNAIADYPIGVITDSQQATMAQAFIDLVLSADGQAVLARHGFMDGH